MFILKDGKIIRVATVVSSNKPIVFEKKERPKLQTKNPQHKIYHNTDDEGYSASWVICYGYRGGICKQHGENGKFPTRWVRSYRKGLEYITFERYIKPGKAEMKSILVKDLFPCIEKKLDI